MLEIHPVTNSSELSEYIEKNSLPENAAVLKAYENGETVGSISMTIEGFAEKAVEMLHTFEYSDDLTGELLIRAAVSYAFNRAVPTVKAPKSMQNAIFDKVGFESDEQNVSIDTKNVVHFCKK